MLRATSSWEADRLLIELSQRDGHFVESGVHLTEHGVWLVLSGGEALPGVATSQDFNPLFYGGDGIQVELAFRDGFDHFFTEHQVVHVLRGDQDTLISG